MNDACLPGVSVVKKKILLQCRRCGFDPWVRKIPWRRAWQPTPVFLPGKSHGQRSLEGYSPWGPKELDRTEQLNSKTCMMQSSNNQSRCGSVLTSGFPDVHVCTSLCPEFPGLEGHIVAFPPLRSRSLGFQEDSGQTFPSRGVEFQSCSFSF